MPQADPATLPLDPGEPACAGPVRRARRDELTLPYLPDPMARGVSFVFPEAGLDRTIPMPFGGEGFTAEYGGSWPDKSPAGWSCGPGRPSAASADGAGSC